MFLTLFFNFFFCLLSICTADVHTASNLASDDAYRCWQSKAESKRETITVELDVECGALMEIEITNNGSAFVAVDGWREATQSFEVPAFFLLLLLLVHSQFTVLCPRIYRQ